MLNSLNGALELNRKEKLKHGYLCKQYFFCKCTYIPIMHRYVGKAVIKVLIDCVLMVRNRI